MCSAGSIIMCLEIGRNIALFLNKGFRNVLGSICICVLWCLLTASHRFSCLKQHTFISLFMGQRSRHSLAESSARLHLKCWPRLHYLEIQLGKNLSSDCLRLFGSIVHLVVRFLAVCFFKASKVETRKMGWSYIYVISTPSLYCRFHWLKADYQSGLPSGGWGFHKGLNTRKYESKMAFLKRVSLDCILRLSR